MRLNSGTLSLVLLLIISSNIFGAGAQIALQHNTWTLVGIPGLYMDGAVPQEWDDDTALDGYSSAGLNADIVDSDGNISYYDSGDWTTLVSAAQADIGVRVVEGELSPDGKQMSIGTYVSVDMGTNTPARIANEAFFTMYLAGAGNPVVRIDYPSQQENKWGKIRFSPESQTEITDFYWFKFSKEYHYASPKQLTSADKYTPAELAADGVAISAIKEIFDDNIDDNNLSALEKSLLRLSTAKPLGSDGVYWRSPLEDDDNLTLYHYDSGIWELYDNRNGIDLNDFNDIESGHGYWAYMQQNDGTNQRAGLFVNANDITPATYGALNLQNGWNMLSFKDQNIRYAATGLYIPEAQLGGGIAIYDAYGRYGAGQSIIDANTTIEGAALFINAYVAQADFNNSSKFGNMRAYPDKNNSALVIFSDRKFESNISTSVTSLAGDSSLLRTLDGNLTSKYGEYVLAFKPITNYMTEPMPGHIQIYFDGYYYTNGYSEYTSSFYEDMEGVANADTVASNLNTDLSAAGFKDYEGNTLKVKSFAIDSDFDGNNDTVVIAANTIFGISDTSRVKIYKMSGNSDGTFYLKGTGQTTAKNLTYTRSDGGSICTGVNAVNAVTGIKCQNYANDNNYSILAGDTYSHVSKPITELEYLELGQATQVEDILSYGLWDATKGPIGEVYGIRQLTAASVATDYNSSFIGNMDLTASYSSSSAGVCDGNVTLTAAVNNLSNTIYWTDDMPASTSPIIDIAQQADKKVVALITASAVNTGANADIRWIALDATKSPDTWYDSTNADIQELLWTEKEKGYWVKLEEFVATNISIDAASSSYLAGSTTVQSHFNNTLDNTGWGETTNHINRSLKVVLDGLTNDNTYTVNAVIAGATFPMRKNSQGKFELRINDTEMGIGEIEGSTDYAITITAADGFGNYFEDDSTYSVGLTTPTDPNVTWTTAGVADGLGLTISATNASTYELHDENISDYAKDSSLILSGAAGAFTNLTSLKAELGWGDIYINKKYYDLKVIAKSSDNLYSDIQGVKFVPAYINSSVLESTFDNGADALPYSFKQGAQLTSNTGVQLEALSAGTYTMAYEERSNGTDMGAAIATYYEVTGGNNIRILFDSSVYDGRPFYVYYDGDVYYGEFNKSSTNPDAPQLLTEIIPYSDTGSQPIEKP